MPSTPKIMQNQIRQFAADLARRRYELDKIPTLQELKAKFGVEWGTLVKYLKKGIADAFGHEKKIEIYREIWRSKIIPKHQEIIRQRGEQLARQFTDPRSDSYHDAAKIPSLKQLQLEFQDHGIETSTSTIQTYLEKGMERVVEKREVPELSRKMRFRREFSHEYLEKVQQMAIQYTRAFIDPSSPHYHDQKAVPTQLKIQDDLTKEKIYMDVRRIVENLKKGVERVVGVDQMETILKQMWPHPEITTELQEMLQNKGREMYIKYSDPKSDAYHDNSKLETIKEIWTGLLDNKPKENKKIKISEMGVYHHVKLGVQLAAGDDYSDDLWKHMFPHAVFPELEEKIAKIGVHWAKEFNQYAPKIIEIIKTPPESRNLEDASNTFKFLQSVPQLRDIQADLKKQELGVPVILSATSRVSRRTLLLRLPVFPRKPRPWAFL